MSQNPVLQDSESSATSPLQKSLAAIKSKLGFRSARAFYDQHLMVRTRLDFNYSYYMKIEGGKINPSAQIISNLCSAFEEEDAEEILLSYCETIFPERASVFKRAKTPKNLIKINPPSAPIAASGGASQTYLTQAQIACLSRSKTYYYAFLLLTLARYPVSVNELQGAMAHAKDAEPAMVDLLIKDFLKAKLIKVQDEKISSIANDMRFPVQDSAAIKKLYEQMDEWSVQFQKEMHFAPVIQKMMLRRVSARYLSVIEAQCNVMIDLIRASDELIPEHNDEVLMLNLSVQRGHLPG